MRTTCAQLRYEVKTQLRFSVIRLMLITAMFLTVLDNCSELPPASDRAFRAHVSVVKASRDMGFATRGLGIINTSP